MAETRRRRSLAAIITVALIFVTVLSLQFLAESHLRNTLLLLDDEIVAEGRPERKTNRQLKEDKLEDNGEQSHQAGVGVVDVLSIGSHRRPELQEAQRESFASHVSTRHFFQATEDDDGDPLCESHLTPQDAYNISIFCKHREDDFHPVRHFMQGQFANVRWLRKKKNPAAWLCAQRRPLHGLYKVLQEYIHTGALLPDYLIVLDDDTYFNLEQFQHLMAAEIDAGTTDTGSDTTIQPYVTAGCLIRPPVHEVNFSFPFGGYGTIFNRPALQKLMRPIHCTTATQTPARTHDPIHIHMDVNTDVCAQLRRNIWGENRVFQNGMTLIDLMQAFVNHMPYRDYAKGLWKGTDGFCMHSDWVIGYFTNFYNISSHTDHVANPYYTDVPQSRMEEWHGSVVYNNKKGFCRNQNEESCKPDDVTCHYMTAQAMINFTDIVRNKGPDRFRDRSHVLQRHHWRVL